MIWGIQSREISDHAAQLAPFIRNFAERSLGRWSEPQLFLDLVSARRQAWVADDFKAVCITALCGETVEIQAAAGSDRELWQGEGTAIIEEWARSLGARHIAVKCRPGWAKHFRGHGYREAHREYVRSL